MYDSRIEDIRDTITAIKIDLDLNSLDYEEEYPLLTVSEYHELKTSIELKLDNIQDILNSLDPSN